MRLAYFEAIGGAAGDMILGALLDAGLSLRRLQGELAMVPVGGYRLERRRVRVHEIEAMQLRVEVEEGHLHRHGQEASKEGPTVAHIESLITRSDLKHEVKAVALRVFGRLAQAIAKVEGLAPEEVRLDPVDFVDSLVDVVGAAIALDLMGLVGVYSAPLPLFHGTIETRHGSLTLPSPATLELAASAGAPTVTSPTPGIQVTPTGAAILTALASFRQPEMAVGRVGYGAGSAELAVPNLLRVSIGDILPAAESERSAPA